MTIVKNFQVDVSEAVAGTDIGQTALAATLFVPDTPASVILSCLPGGSYPKEYWDIQASGENKDYSFARYMTARGIMVVTLDHLGLGKSSLVTDGNALTAEVISRANHAAMQNIRERLAKGTLFPDLPPMELVSLGVGHSMGAFLSIFQQSAWSTHEGMVLLGWSNYPLQVDNFVRRWAQAAHITLEEDMSCYYDILSQMYQTGENGFVHVFRPAARGLFYLPDVPTELIEEDTARAVDVPAPILLQLSNFSTLQKHARQIQVPVFLGFGQIDVAADPEREAATYGSQKVTTFLLPGSAHCHNFASQRHLLWQRIADWVEENEVFFPHPARETAVR